MRTVINKGVLVGTCKDARTKSRWYDELTSDFRAAALDALEAIETPSNPIFFRDVRLPTRPAPAPPAPVPLGEAPSARGLAPMNLAPLILTLILYSLFFRLSCATPSYILALPITLRLGQYRLTCTVRLSCISSQSRGLPPYSSV